MALQESPRTIKRRKELFDDCALVEIIHLHDCLRGALRALAEDVEALGDKLTQGEEFNAKEANDLEGKVNGRFNVIWSVFRAHSKAEDEFIWPALRSKTNGKITRSPQYHPGEDLEASQEKVPVVPNLAQPDSPDNNVADYGVMDSEAYEEDHADEERMFSKMDHLMNRLRGGLTKLSQQRKTSGKDDKSETIGFVNNTMQDLRDLSKKLCQHLMAHLEKEERQCMPLVAKHLSKSEIHELVGQIMGKRSSDMITEIMSMAVQSLNQKDRLQMIKYMKQAMAGTFFDEWLSMSGWMEDKEGGKQNEAVTSNPKRTVDQQSRPQDNEEENSSKKQKTQQSSSDEPLNTSKTKPIHTNVDPIINNPLDDITSQEELENRIRSIAKNPNLDAKKKNDKIQELRDTVWKSNQLLKSKQKTSECSDGSVVASYAVGSAAASATGTQARRLNPPAMYYKKDINGKIKLEWDIDDPKLARNRDSVPLFAASELAPTYHDGATGGLLGCPHYARACKLRHPVSNKLYTCRLCCEQERELPSKDQDEPLDRYAVQEVMCMKCNTLQPTNDRCINPNCETAGKPFAKYYCKICHLYDDQPRPIFHCPFCNTCRSGRGLGIDFRHCMRCNACVSLEDQNHRCIPQKLQGTCPICHEGLFQSTEQLRGLRCGHVMHLSCYNSYRRGQRYTCPLCMKSMEDMRDYFALLDAAVRMQPMPASYLGTMSNIYCQDCEKSGQCPYHFVGQKCPHCGSYNTRELGRVLSFGTSGAI